MLLTAVQAPRQTWRVQENVIVTAPPLKSVVLNAPKPANMDPCEGLVKAGNSSTSVGQLSMTTSVIVQFLSQICRILFFYSFNYIYMIKSLKFMYLKIIDKKINLKRLIKCLSTFSTYVA